MYYISSSKIYCVDCTSVRDEVVRVLTYSARGIKREKLYQDVLYVYETIVSFAAANGYSNK